MYLNYLLPTYLVILGAWVPPRPRAGTFSLLKIGRSRRGRMGLINLAATAIVALVAPPPSTVVVGAGPAGLATAIALANRGWPQITVLDRLRPPPPLDDVSSWSDTARFYLIGIGGRGQRALRQIGAWEQLEPLNPPHRGLYA